MADEELSAADKIEEIEELPNFALVFGNETEQERKISEHRTWLKNIRHERPSPSKKLRVAIYIRYFNQTKYDNYLDFHIKQYTDTMALCPNWKLVDFYVDKGATAPNMETAPNWNRLLQDCMDGKVDLIITQKISNVSKKIHEISFCARILAAMAPPVGIYFVSEDIYTMASYYSHDLRDSDFFPDDEWTPLPFSSEELESLPEGRRVQTLLTHKDDCDDK